MQRLGKFRNKNHLTKETLKRYTYQEERENLRYRKMVKTEISNMY